MKSTLTCACVPCAGKLVKLTFVLRIRAHAAHGRNGAYTLHAFMSDSTRGWYKGWEIHPFSLVQVQKLEKIAVWDENGSEEWRLLPREEVP